MSSKRWFSFALGIIVCLAAIVPVFAQAPSIKEQVERSDFRFKMEHASVLHCVRQYTGDPELQLIVRPKERLGLWLSFVLDGRETLRLPVGWHTVFEANKGVLYFARYDDRGNGCAVVAYDLKTGNELWKATVEGVGTISHFAYFNHVNLIANEYCIAIFGHEGYGDYLEVLDAKSGKLLANKVFRKGFEP